LFGIKAERTRALAAEIGAVTAGWRDAAKSLGLSKAQADRMETAFEHDDLQLALKLEPVSLATKPAKAASKPKGAPKRRQKAEKASPSAGASARSKKAGRQSRR
jgi:hypothetical protein